MTRARTELNCLNAALHIPLVTARVDRATTDRIDAWAQAELAKLSPDRRAELERWWLA